MKPSELKTIIDEADVTKDEADKSRMIVDLTTQLNKVVSVVAKDVKEAKELALELITNEPQTIRGFSLELES